jgi:hypothetical protein
MNRRVGSAGVLAGALLACGVAALHAQGPTTDPRWRAWLGCWRAAETAPAPLAAGRAELVCVLPTTDAAAVELVTVAGARVEARRRLQAPGEDVAVSREGCDGRESARWSHSGARLLVHAELVCPGAPGRTVNEILTLSAPDTWLWVQGVAAQGPTGVRVVLFRYAGLPGAVPDAVAAGLTDLLGDTGEARTAAAAPVTLPDVVEAGRHLDAAVVEAWLAVLGRPFALDGRTVLALADSGVPEHVIDVMVALSYPKVFTVDAATHGVRPVTESPDTVAGLYPAPRYAGFYDGYQCWTGSWGCWGYGYLPLGDDYYAYGPRYGYRYGGGVALVTPRQESAHGRVVPGRGYVQGGAPGAGGNVAVPRSAPSADRGYAPSAGASRSSGGSGSGSGTSTGRTAKPRP